MKFLIEKKFWVRSLSILIALLLTSESFVFAVTKVYAEEVVTEQETTVEQIEEVENVSDTQSDNEIEEVPEEEESNEEESESIPENPQGDASIETGDATADVLIENTANTNETNTQNAVEADEDLASTTEESSEPEASTATSSSEDSQEAKFGFVNSSGDDITASSTNEADIETTATVTAATGDNTASGESANIVTGNAVAVANVVNLANTNILNSDGFIGFFNSLGIGGTNLSSLFTVFDNSTSASTLPCAESICGGGDSFTVNNTNNANVQNNINVTANTGQNNAYGTNGANISTGDAFAAANIFNVVNTNITDSNYLLLSFNNFGSYNGDIVLPNSSMFSQLFNQTSGVSGPTVTNNNTANIENNLSVDADTGENEVNGGGTINTGNSFASGNVVNQVNQNLFGSDSFLMVLRVHGNWSGNIFGLPDGVGWNETERGIELYSNRDEGRGRNLDANVTNNNTANISNNVSVYALTGDNKATGDNGSKIETGNAYAGGNVVNLANTNILGQNWATLVFDIFGDWNGNLSFGQPDLWVGAQAESDGSRIIDGDEVMYTFTVTNFGDVTAENVSLKSFFSKYDLNFPSRSVQFDSNRYAHFSESIGSLAPGETKTVRAAAKVGALPHGKQVSIPLTIEATSDQSESNMDNNKDTVTILAGVKRSEDTDPRNHFGASMYIDKSASVSEVTEFPTQVDYTITIENKGGKAYHALLIDTLIAPDGTTVHEERWELDTIGRETITIDYSLNFTADMPSGVYRNEAQVVALDRHESIHHGVPFLSEIVSAEVTVAGPGGQVLGIATECPAYITQFMQQGSNNDETEVQKLQTFLNNNLGTNLSESGIFDYETHEAVQQFQKTYRDEVLLPWGMAYPSGYVYLTTRKKINEIYCRGERHFPLATAEKAEIERYRYIAEQTIQAPQDLAHNNETGTINSESLGFTRREDIKDNHDNQLTEPLLPTVRDAKKPLVSVFNPLINTIRTWFPFVTR